MRKELPTSLKPRRSVWARTGTEELVKEQGDHDKSFPILDCTQRLKGYTYVMGIDKDEVLMPAKHDNIKDFAKEMFTVRTMSRSIIVHLYKRV